MKKKKKRNPTQKDRIAELERDIEALNGYYAKLAERMRNANDKIVTLEATVRALCNTENSKWMTAFGQELIRK